MARPRSLHRVLRRIARDDVQRRVDDPDEGPRRHAQWGAADVDDHESMALQWELLRRLDGGLAR